VPGMAPGFVVPGMTGLQAAALPGPAFSAPPGADPSALGAHRRRTHMSTPHRSSRACPEAGCRKVQSACLSAWPVISLARHCLNSLARKASCSCAGVTRCSAGALAAPSQQATRHARRVYVGGLPPTATEQNVATFFSNALATIGGTTAGPGEAALSACLVLG